MERPLTIKKGEKTGKNRIKNIENTPGRCMMKGIFKAFIFIFALLIFGSGEAMAKEVAIFGSSSNPNKIFFLDPETQNMLGEIDLDSRYLGGIYGVAVDSESGIAFAVVKNEAGKLLAINIKNREIIAEKDVGNNPLGVILSPDKKKIYVAVSYENVVKEYEFSGGVFTMTNSYSAGEGPVGLGMFGSRLYVANWLGNTILAINTQTGETRTIRDMYQPVAFDVCGGQVFAVGESYVNQVLDGLLMKIDDLTGSVISKWKIGEKAQRSVAVTSDCQTTYVADSDGHTILEVNSETGASMSLFSIKYPGAVSLNSGDKKLVAVSFDESGGEVVTWDRETRQVVGRLAFEQQLAVFGKFIATIPDQTEPATVTITKTGESLKYGTVYYSGKALVFDKNGKSIVGELFEGDEITFTASTSSASAVFNGWTGCYSVINGVCTVKLAAGANNVTASFMKPAKIAVSPGSVNFGNTAMGVPSAVKSIVVKNSGSADLLINSASINSSEFQVISSTCTNPVPKGATCTIGVQVNASGYGSRIGQLNVVSNAGTKSVRLQANCKPPAVSTSSSVSFSKITVGSSASKVLNIKNSGVSNLEISSLDVSGDFQVSGNCTTVAQGASCQITVTFTPAAKGSRTGTLIIGSNDPKGVKRVALRGTGG